MNTSLSLTPSEEGKESFLRGFESVQSSRTGHYDNPGDMKNFAKSRYPMASKRAKLSVLKASQLDKTMRQSKPNFHIRSQARFQPELMMNATASTLWRGSGIGLEKLNRTSGAFNPNKSVDF